MKIKYKHIICMDKLIEYYIGTIITLIRYLETYIGTFFHILYTYFVSVLDIFFYVLEINQQTTTMSSNFRLKNYQVPINTQRCLHVIIVWHILRKLSSNASIYNMYKVYILWVAATRPSKQYCYYDIMI